jgi:hypothetical protein
MIRRYSSYCGRSGRQQSGETVVVKPARRHVLGNSGLAAQQALRHEAAVLDALAPLGHTPLKLALFEQGRDLFFAQQMIDGVALRQWIRDEAGLFGPSCRSCAGALRLGSLRAGAMRRRIDGVTRSITWE